MSHLSNHMVFNSATSSLNKNLFKGRVSTSMVIEINFVRHIDTSLVVPRKVLWVFRGEMFNLYICHWSYRLKNKMKNGSIMKYF